MKESGFRQGFEARIGHFGLDERARAMMKEAWPLIAPHLDNAIDELLAAVGKLPHIAEIIAGKKEMIKQLEASHYQALLGGGLDSHYIESCRRTVEQEAAIGLDGRMRSTAGNHVLRVALKALERKYWLSGKMVERAAVVSQLIALDVTNAMALHREFAEKGGCGAARRHRRGDCGFRRRHRRRGRRH